MRQHSFNKYPRQLRQSYWLKGCQITKKNAALTQMRDDIHLHVHIQIVSLRYIEIKEIAHTGNKVNTFWLAFPLYGKPSQWGGDLGQKLNEVDCLAFEWVRETWFNVTHSQLNFKHCSDMRTDDALYTTALQVTISFARFSVLHCLVSY